MYPVLASAASGDTGNTILGALFVIVLIWLIVLRKHKKSHPDFRLFSFLLSKLRKKPSSHVSVSMGSTVPPASRMGSYVGDNYLVSIAQFQKVAFDRYVVIDFETTGLDPDADRIIEMAAVRVQNGKIIEHFHSLVNPGIPIPAESFQIHGINDSMVAKAPRIEDVLPSFLDFIGSDLPAAHNAKFDASFLIAACSRCGLPYPPKYFDTMRLSVYWPNLGSRSLANFLDRAGIKNTDAHRSLGDAIATAKLIIASMKKVA